MNDVLDPRVEEIIGTVELEIRALIGVTISDHEKSFIREGLNMTRKRTPNNYASVLVDMEDITRLESEYNYLIYSLIQYLEKYNVEFRSQYNAIVASLTRAGRPNQAAVEAEALARDNNKLLLLKNRNDRLEQLISYLKTEIAIIRSKTKTLDAKRSNTFQFTFILIV